MTRPALALRLFAAACTVSASLFAQTATPDPFAINAPLASYALSSCGDLSMSDGVIDSQNFSSSVVASSGDIISDGNIKVSGGTVNGNAPAGPGKNVTLSGSGKVTGTKSSAATAYNCTPIDLAALTTTLKTTNDNATIPLTTAKKNALGGTTHTH